ncbi:MAG: hypothetical protein HY922_11300 [Elusimicrobia bacterium]|nr:hypothetical protein [Elusimicrobiota bacterium]
MPRLLLFLALAGGPAAPACAYRPLETEDAGVVGKRKLQLETSWDRMRTQNSESLDCFLLTTAYGLTENIEVSVQAPISVIKPDEEARMGGLGDFALYYKHAALKENGKRPGIMGQAYWRTDSGDSDRGLGAGYQELGVLGVASKALGRWQVNAMAGGALALGGGEDFGNAFQYGASLDYRLSRGKERPLYLLSEIVGGENPRHGMERWGATWFWGLLFEPSPRLAIDAGIGWGLDRASPHWRTTLGSTWNF